MFCGGMQKRKMRIWEGKCQYLTTFQSYLQPARLVGANGSKGFFTGRRRRLWMVLTRMLNAAIPVGAAMKTVKSLDS